MRGANLAGESRVPPGTSRSNMAGRQRQYIQGTMNITNIQGSDPNMEAILQSW